MGTWEESTLHSIGRPDLMVEGTKKKNNTHMYRNMSCKLKCVFFVFKVDLILTYLISRGSFKVYYGNRIYKCKVSRVKVLLTSLTNTAYFLVRVRNYIAVVAVLDAGIVVVIIIVVVVYML